MSEKRKFMEMKKKVSAYIKIVRFFILISLIIILLQGCRSCGYDFELSYASPQGTNRIIVKYDFMSRPSIFKRGFLRDKKIWEYGGSGFMETVTFHVEWISENEICFSYDDIQDEYDEEYVIVV